MDPEVRRRFGVYFTPREVAGYVVRSADLLAGEAFGVGLAGCRIIEPALGDGEFAVQVLQMAPGARVLGYEIVPEIAVLARRRIPGGVEIRVCNALAGFPALAPGDIPVILGNPPWHGHSSGTAGLDLLRDWYPTGERNTKWLRDDYLRFLRWAQEVVVRAGRGVVGMVINHSWLRGPTHREVRSGLLGAFDDVRVLDLHGSLLRPERGPGGSRDQNVFPVRPGAAIVLLVRTRGLPGVFRLADLLGARVDKLSWLAEHDAGSTPWREVPHRDGGVFARWPSLTDVFGVSGVGMVSGSDRDAYFPTVESLLARHPDVPRGDLFQAVYRPDCLRWTAFALHVRPRRRLMVHLLAPGARALIALRQSGPGVLVRHMVACRPIDNCVLSTQSTARAYAFPLKLASGAWNLDPAPLGLSDPEEAFEYILSMLGDPAYQREHRADLLRDFPRIPPARA